MTSDELRPIVLASWNCRFWFLLSHDFPIWSCHALDVHTAIAKLLTSMASNVDAHQHITPLVGVSVEGPSGPWVSFPIGPAYRQAPTATRTVVRRLIAAEYPHIVDEWLEQGDVESYEAWREMNLARP